MGGLRITPHLCFDGRCEEAFGIYRQVLGGQITTMLTYGESPMAEHVDAKWHGMIAHATLRLDGQELFGVDALPDDYESPGGMYVTVNVVNPEDARRLFAALCDAGTVRVPYNKTFWSAGFGVLIDRFGIPWEINCEG
jgi:PhnB protein